MTWVFGYGSLIFRPGFPHLERKPGFIEGWTRKFWQGSTDHRGVPEAPGRVVTLRPVDRGRCWGVAYRVDPAARDDVLARLDHREKGGYTRQEVTVHGTTSRVSALVYVATEDNPNYLGPAPMDEMVTQIEQAVGPSGRNLDYLLALADALTEMGADDPHVFELARRVRARRDVSA